MNKEKLERANLLNKYLIKLERDINLLSAFAETKRFSKMTIWTPESSNIDFAEMGDSAIEEDTLRTIQSIFDFKVNAMARLQAEFDNLQ